MMPLLPLSGGGDPSQRTDPDPCPCNPDDCLGPFPTREEAERAVNTLITGEARHWRAALYTIVTASTAAIGAIEYAQSQAANQVPFTIVWAGLCVGLVAKIEAMRSILTMRVRSHVTHCPGESLEMLRDIHQRCVDEGSWGKRDALERLMSNPLTDEEQAYVRDGS